MSENNIEIRGMVAPGNDRMGAEEEISQKILAAREAGKSRAGYPLPVEGAGRKGVRKEVGKHPHNKPGRLDPHGRDTIRGREPGDVVG